MRKILALPLVLALLALVPVVPAAAATKVIVLPGASSAEGIAAGEGSTFYAGDLVEGDIFRGDIRRGTAELFIDAPEGTEAAGMAVDTRHDLLFVAGGPVLTGGVGRAYVYSTRTGATVATYDLGEPGTSLVNDVTITPFGAWFTDSLQPRLYFVPVVRGVPGPVRTLELSGPAAGQSGAFHLNGITSTPSGNTLLVANALGELCRINPVTGTSEVIPGVTVPSSDGLELSGRQLWVVQSFYNQVSRWRLSADLSSGTADGVIADPAFQIPLTAAKFGDRLAVVNSHLDTGLPPNHPTYEVIVVNAR
jgi:sugar lactone lactonase YvrE